MGKVAFVFPGQGAQSVGMGQDIYDHMPEIRDVFEAANDALDFDLLSMIFKGPDSELKKTYNTQPALLTTSVAYLKALQSKGIQADYVAGHSLGEYSALVAAGVLSLKDAVAIVRARGQFMEQAVPDGHGAMAAVLGASREALTQLCLSVTESGQIVELANMNCPGQIVISGSTAGVAEVSERVKEAGGKRAIALEVSGPFHSSMMKAAANQLEIKLDTITFYEPIVPIVANVTAQTVKDSSAIRQLLVEQVYSPVLWEDSVQFLISQGVDTFIEIGPGNVLTGLIKKIDKTVKVININRLASLEFAL
ncbi:ACP S-malonyltransferase [Paenibacillus crassostreae]|uniref:Malonyl CoA-acyl carrier protein transacylase n=1 Tax=Paenibacillus crassostreae TaxID=1763538 RepID=A0A167FPV6_9BACL|nr:ACP S-malonyltransferase [Paenibacillus crassostreae]AOZ94185.1 [acyl-carrier-protein] S-malonyltransferase [Paenibacillus crassostreae]OAB76779.1 malonyl CoA-ACP transacylase [Paenibacillus crassostreae]